MTCLARGVGRLHRVDGLHAKGGPSRAALASASIALALASCSAPPPTAATVVVHARTEVGANVPNADLFAGTTLVARTDREGAARLDIRGADGETFYVRVDCPPGFKSPAEPLALQKPRVTATPTIPEYPVVCHPLRHAMVIGVRADGGPDLPVLYLGKEIARTDRSGAAHVTVAMEAHEKIELILSTNGKEGGGLHPQNPMAVFEMPDHDDVQVFPVTFTRDPRDGKRLRR